MAPLQAPAHPADILARREMELDLLRDMAGALRELVTEEQILDVSVELLMGRLGISAIWVFLAEEGSHRLRLAASRGVSEQFLSHAMKRGMAGCLCLDVFEAGRFRVARNTDDCPRMPVMIPGSPTAGHACIPLKLERGVLGVMNLANRPGRAFTDDELGFLETAGRQISLAVDRARAARENRRHNAETRALVSLARAIGGSLDQPTVLGAVVQCARELLGADRCTIFLGDGAAPFVFASLSGPPIAGLGIGGSVQPEAFGFPLFESALRRRRAIAIASAQDHPNFVRGLAQRWGIGSVIVAPLLAHERLEGLLLADRLAPAHWEATEVELADGLAGQAAVAIENARLYRDARESLVRLQEAQDGMMRSERMAALGTLASCLAHEVRNPLNAISLSLVLLDRRLSALPETSRGDLREIIDGARGEISRLDELVEEFLSLSTIDHLCLADADAEEILQEVAALMSPDARQRSIVISVGSEGTVPPLSVDREKIKQALINLVRNAVEAMPQGGSIALTAAECGDGVRLNVADTGPGVEQGPEVFDFFVTTKPGGTGLGLPIARRIVEAHGGALTFANGPERGATFTVKLMRN